MFSLSPHFAVPLCYKPHSPLMSFGNRVSAERGLLFSSPSLACSSRHYLSSFARTFPALAPLPSKEDHKEELSPATQARNFVLQLGHDGPVADGVLAALVESGVTGTALLSTIQSLAGRWEVGEDAGLEDLVAAVKLDLARREGRQRITLYCVPASAWQSSSSEESVDDDGPDVYDMPPESEEEHSRMMSQAFAVEGLTGLTLRDVAKFGDGPGAAQLGETLECACAGIMACSTCHVVVDPLWYDRPDNVVGKPSDAEQDMLDLAYSPRRTSRLACQIELVEAMDGMVFRLPRDANNLMDYVPFQDKK